METDFLCKDPRTQKERIMFGTILMFTLPWIRRALKLRQLCRLCYFYI